MYIPLTGCLKSWLHTIIDKPSSSSWSSVVGVVSFIFRSNLNVSTETINSSKFIVTPPSTFFCFFFLCRKPIKFVCRVDKWSFWFKLSNFQSFVNRSYFNRIHTPHSGNACLFNEKGTIPCRFFVLVEEVNSRIVNFVPELADFGRQILAET